MRRRSGVNAKGYLQRPPTAIRGTTVAFEQRPWGGTRKYERIVSISLPLRLGSQGLGGSRAHSLAAPPIGLETPDSAAIACHRCVARRTSPISVQTAAVATALAR